MELDILKSAWSTMATATKPNTEISNMMKENTHPVLKRIRKQLIIESIGFLIFLFVYYDFFDGDQKPVFVNALLVLSVIFGLVHNGMLYQLSRHPFKEDSIKLSLENYLTRLKSYAIVSVASRVLFAVSLLIFFSGVITFTVNKYWMLSGIIVIFIIQLVVLSGIWIGRIRRIKTNTALLD